MIPPKRASGAHCLQRIRPYFRDAHVTLYCGDTRLILPHLGEAWADAVVTDPPYGIDLQPGWGKTKAIANDTRREAKSLWWSVIPLLHRAAKPDTAHVMFAGCTEAWAADVLREWFTVKGSIAWKKRQLGLGFYLRRQWELAWYLHKGKPPLPEQAPSDVWEGPRVCAPDHSCQKPIWLMRRAIELAGGRVILDPFSGSGSTLLAAKGLGLRAVGIELEEEYCQLTVRRLLAGDGAGMGANSVP